MDYNIITHMTISNKTFPKIFIIFCIAVFVLQLAALVFLILQPAEVQAVDLQVAIDDQKSVSGIGEYIALIYKYGTGVVGILAAVVMMVGGLMWLTAGGNTSQVQSAQEWIKAALTGLIIALLSYIILLTINPDLVKFKPLKIDKVEKVQLDKESELEKQKTLEQWEEAERNDAPADFNPADRNTH